MFNDPCASGGAPQTAHPFPHDTSIAHTPAPTLASAMQSADQFAELTSYLRLIHTDKALCGAFRAQHPELVALLREVLAEEPQLKLQGPYPGGMTVIQTTLFDNWGGPKPPSQNYPFARFGIEVRAWARTPASKAEWNAPSWHGECRNLWPRQTAVAKVKRLMKRNLKCPISEGDLDGVETLRDSGFDNMGIMHHKVLKSHTEYFHEHFVAVEWINGAPAVWLLFPNGRYRMTKFTPLNHDNRPLREKLPTAFGQVRWSSDPKLTVGPTRGWAHGCCEELTSDG